MYQAKLTLRLESPQLPKASDCMSCPGAQKGQRRGKRATCKRKDKTNVKWEGKIFPKHKQINFHALFRDCAVSDGDTSSTEKENIQGSQSFKTAALPQGKDPGKQLRGEAS